MRKPTFPTVNPPPGPGSASRSAVIMVLIASLLASIVVAAPPASASPAASAAVPVPIPNPVLVPAPGSTSTGVSGSFEIRVDRVVDGATTVRWDRVYAATQYRVHYWNSLRPSQVQQKWKSSSARSAAISNLWGPGRTCFKVVAPLNPGGGVYQEKTSETKCVYTPDRPANNLSFSVDATTLDYLAVRYNDLTNFIEPGDLISTGDAAMVHHGDANGELLLAGPFTPNRRVCLGISVYRPQANDPDYQNLRKVYESPSQKCATVGSQRAGELEATYNGTPPSILTRGSNNLVNFNDDFRDWYLTSNMFPDVSIESTMQGLARDIASKCGTKIANPTLPGRYSGCVEDVFKDSFGTGLAAFNESRNAPSWVKNLLAVTQECVTMFAFGQVGARMPGAQPMSGFEFVMACAAEVGKNRLMVPEGMVFSWNDYEQNFMVHMAAELFAALPIMLKTGGWVAIPVAITAFFEYLLTGEKPVKVPSRTAWMIEQGSANTLSVSDTTWRTLQELDARIRRAECQCTSKPALTGWNITRSRAEAAIRDWLRHTPGERWFDWTLHAYPELSIRETGVDYIAQGFMDSPNSDCRRWMTEQCRGEALPRGAALVFESLYSIDVRCRVNPEVLELSATRFANHRSHDQPFTCGAPPATAPSARPNINSWQAQSPTRMNIAWSSVSGASSYEYATCNASSGSSVTATSTTITLPASSKQCYKVRAKSAGGAGPWSTDKAEFTMPESGASIGSNYPAPGGNVQIRSRHYSNSCLDEVATSRSTTDLVLNRCNGSASQRFTVMTSDSGTVRIKRSGTSRCLEVAGWGLTNGTNVRLNSCHWEANGKWHLLNASGSSSGWAELRPQHNPRACLDVWAGGQHAPSANANMKQWECHNRGDLLNQDWKLEAQSGSTPVTPAPQPTPQPTTPPSTSCSGSLWVESVKTNNVVLDWNYKCDTTNNYKVDCTCFSGIKDSWNTSERHVGGLQAGTNYKYRVQSAGKWSSWKSFKTANAAAPAASVRITGFTSSWNGHAKIDWSDVPNANWYRVKYRPQSGTSWQTAHPGNTTTYTANGLASGQNWCFEVIAYNGGTKLATSALRCGWVRG